MGVPIKRLICASNPNNVLTDFLTNGCYDIKNRRLFRTSSPAIDILVSSNLERLLYSLSGRDSRFVKASMESLLNQRCFEIPGKVRVEGNILIDFCFYRNITNCEGTWCKIIKENTCTQCQISFVLVSLVYCDGSAKVHVK